MNIAGSIVSTGMSVKTRLHDIYTMSLITKNKLLNRENCAIGYHRDLISEPKGLFHLTLIPPCEVEDRIVFILKIIWMGC